MLLTNNSIEELKNYFNSKPEFGERLPNVKDVADKTIFYLKSGSTYIEHVSFKGKWYKKTVNGDSEIILTEI